MISDRITTPIIYLEIVFIIYTAQDKVGVDSLAALIYESEFDQLFLIPSILVLIACARTAVLKLIISQSEVFL